MKALQVDVVRIIAAFMMLIILGNGLKAAGIGECG
jgi:hypothetical protein